MHDVADAFMLVKCLQQVHFALGSFVAIGVSSDDNFYDNFTESLHASHIDIWMY